MDTERDENQNLKNDLDTRQDNSLRNNENEFQDDEILADDDYTDDQNNSNTGYTEKLLEKDFNQKLVNKVIESEKELEIEDDLIVKNGNILNDEIPDKSNDNENFENNDSQ